MFEKVRDSSPQPEIRKNIAIEGRLKLSHDGRPTQKTLSQIKIANKNS